MKEIRLTPNIAKHDLETKIKQAKEFLSKGHQIKASVFFKGRLIAYSERGKWVLLTLLNELEDFGTAHGDFKMAGKRMQIMINPKKK